MLTTMQHINYSIHSVHVFLSTLSSIIKCIMYVAPRHLLRSHTTNNFPPKDFYRNSYPIVFEREHRTVEPDHTAFKSLTTKSLQQI